MHCWSNLLAGNSALPPEHEAVTDPEALEHVGKHTEVDYEHLCEGDKTHNFMYGQRKLVSEHLVVQRRREIAHHLGCIATAPLSAHPSAAQCGPPKYFSKRSMSSRGKSQRRKSTSCRRGDLHGNITCIQLYACPRLDKNDIQSAGHNSHRVNNMSGWDGHIHEHLCRPIDAQPSLVAHQSFGLTVSSRCLSVFL